MKSRFKIRRRSILRREGGFSLLELIVVVAVMGILATIAIANLKQTPRRAQEAVLKTNLRTLREVIDQFYADQGTYPASLEDLVGEGYLRKVPEDPLTGEPDWQTIFEDELSDPDDFGGGLDDWDDPIDEFGEGGPGIIDVKSNAAGDSLDGEPYADW